MAETELIEVELTKQDLKMLIRLTRREHKRALNDLKKARALRDAGMLRVDEETGWNALDASRKKIEHTTDLIQELEEAHGPWEESPPWQMG